MPQLSPSESLGPSGKAELMKDTLIKRHASLPGSPSSDLKKLINLKQQTKQQYVKRPLSKPDLNRINIANQPYQRPLTATSKTRKPINHNDLAQVAVGGMFNNKAVRIVAVTPD